MILKKRLAQIFLVSLFMSLGLTLTAQAGFGISPPYVINRRLVPGSHYEQKINLSRSDPNEDLTVQVIIDESEVKNWISIDPSQEFTFPKGQNLTSMTVKVDVPKDAKLKNYTGYIRTEVIPKAVSDQGQVSIALGARIDVDLTVGKGDIFDFLVRAINILDVAKKPWPLSYFNRIEVPLTVENTGNIKSSPTKVHLDVYDIYEKEILETKEDVKLKQIKPFEVKSIVAEFPANLKAGSYYGDVKVYKEDEVSREEKITFSVIDTKFSIKDWIIIILGSLAALIILVFGYWFLIVRYNRQEGKKEEKTIAPKNRKPLSKT